MGEWIPAAMPELLVVGSDRPWYKTLNQSLFTHPAMTPVMLYNYAADRVQGHYLVVGSLTGTVSLTLNMGPQGSAFNVSSNAIATMFGSSSGNSIYLSVFEASTLISDGAAFSAGGTSRYDAVHSWPTGSVTLSNSNVPSIQQVFLLPYTSTHFLIVAPAYVWRIRISDCSVENSFAIDPQNASYSRFVDFSDALPLIAAPIVLADGSLVCFMRTARNAADSADETIAALVKIDPVAGTTVATDYTSLSSNASYLVPLEDGSFMYASSRRYASDLSGYTASTSTDTGAYSWAGPDKGDSWWIIGSAGGTNPVYPVFVTNSSGASVGVAKTGGGGGAATTNSSGMVYDQPIVSVVDTDKFLARSATGTGTGTGIGSYIGVYNKSDGSVGTGYTKQQMVDYYGGMSISGSGFNSLQFDRINSRSWPDPTLYTVREVVKTMGEEDVPAVIGSPSNVTAEGSGLGSVNVSFDYGTLIDDSLTHFLIYIGTSGSPDWNAATTYAPGVIQSSYSTTVVTLETGTLYCAVRAVGAGSLTADSATISFFYDPNATVAVPTNVAVTFEGSANTSWDYNAIGGDVLLGFLVYVGQSATPNWSLATNVSLAGGTTGDSSFSYDVPTKLKGRAYVAVRAYGSGGITATSEVILAAATPYDAELATAATNGLDVTYIAAIYFGGSVGTQYYSTREIVVGASSHVPKLIGIPELQKRIDPSVLRAEPLSDSVTLRLVNSPEGPDGTTDANRIQTLLKAAGTVGLRVDIGLASANQGIFVTNYTDGVYRIDQVTASNNEVAITCVDRMLQPGEKMIGATVTAADWPVAPAESLNVVRGPVFGKVDGLPLVPVEVGMSAVLASEIDEQDTLIYLSVDDMSLWPTSGWVEIGDEIIQYSTLDTTAKRLGSVMNPCVRGLGFPATTPAAHASGAVAHEFYSGRVAVLDGALDAVATSISLVAPEYLPSAGVVRIDNEYIAYIGKTGNTLTGCVRGWAAPTIAKVHDIGSPVRTIPIGPDGQPRYRYVVGEGQVSAISSLRVQDEGMSLLPYSGGTAVLSQVTGTGSGTVWSVVDLPARPRFEKFDSSGSQVPVEWVMETDGAVDGEGVATPESFLRWRAGAGMSSDHLLTWPRAIDLEASTRAVILEAETNKNVFSVEFDAGWDIGANAPRSKYGRFRDARLRIRVQYDRQTTIQPEFQVWSNGLMYKSGYFQPPTLGGTTGDGTVSGSQTLPASRWNTQPQTRDVRFSFRTTDLYSDNFVGYWIDPGKIQGLVPGGGRPDHTAAVDGDTRSFVSGGWRHSPAGPLLKTEENPGLDLGDLELFSNDIFPETTSTDIITSLELTLYNPVGLSSAWTGYTAQVRLYPNSDYTGTPIIKTFSMANNVSKKVVTIDLTGEGYPVTWAHIQSVKIGIDQWHQIGFDNKGVTVGNVALAVKYVPDVEGQRVGTIVDGSYFSATATTTPSTIYDQVVSLGATAKEAARNAGVDPWMFFTDISGGEGMRVVVSLPTTGGLRFAVADVFLELEYEALTVVYDGTVLADADGRTGEPVGGGASVLLENPVDILKLLIDSTEFCSFGHLAGVRDGASWAAARSLTQAVGWKMARAIVEPVPLRDLVASICAESRLALLSDSLYFYLRARLDEPSVDDSVRLVGTGTDPEYALVRDDVAIVNQVTDVYNSIGFKYRRSYLTGDFQAVVEKVDTGSITLYGKRATTMDLQWHQSARGYAEGISGQDAALELLTGHVIARSARLWDYTTIELPLSAAEDLQRLDVITLNYPRSGYTNTPGWVIQKQRLTNPLRWQVVLQL